MTTPTSILFHEIDLEAIAGATGRVAVFLPADGKLDQAARRVNKLTRGALARFAEGEGFAKMKPGEARALAYPAGLAAEAVDVVRLDRRPSVEEARKAGAALAKAQGEAGMLVLAGSNAKAAEIAFGLALRGYAFTDHKSEEAKPRGTVTMMVTRPEEVAAQAGPMAAVAEGVFFTRDLVNEPSNILTTEDFAARLAAMQELGLEVEILEEDELEKLGMRALLAVGQGSASPSKVVVMQWNGGKTGEAPFALVGKGVVFDTGGISLKPAAGMEEMTMDMGGGAVVSGVMRTLALRKAAVNVVGLVGLVENMPSGTAPRPGAEGRRQRRTTGGGQSRNGRGQHRQSRPSAEPHGTLAGRDRRRDRAAQALPPRLARQRPGCPDPHHHPAGPACRGRRHPLLGPAAARRGGVERRPPRPAARRAQGPG